MQIIQSFEALEIFQINQRFIAWEIFVEICKFIPNGTRTYKIIPACWSNLDNILVCITLIDLII